MHPLQQRRPAVAQRLGEEQGAGAPLEVSPAQQAEEPTQPDMGLEEPGLKEQLGSLGAGRRVSWAGPHRNPSHHPPCSKTPATFPFKKALTGSRPSPEVFRGKAQRQGELMLLPQWVLLGSSSCPPSKGISPQLTLGCPALHPAPVSAQEPGREAP